MVKKNLIAALAVTLALGLGEPLHAQSYDGAVAAYVTDVEASYMPTQVVFKVDQTVGNCAVGQFLTWTPRGSTQSMKDQNAQAVLALLMTARAANLQVGLYYKNSTCSIEFMHLL